MTTDWTIETDEGADKRQRNGAIFGRFQVCHPAEGFVGDADTLAEAMDMADRYETRRMPDGRLYCGKPGQAEVYDRMARRGKPRTWRRGCDGTWAVVETRAVGN